MRSNQLLLSALVLAALASPALADEPAKAPVVREGVSTIELQAAGDAPQTARPPKELALRHADLARAHPMRISMSSTGTSSISPGRRLAPGMAPGGMDAAPASPESTRIVLPHGMALGAGAAPCASTPPQGSARAGTSDDLLARGGNPAAAGADQRGAQNVITPATIGANQAPASSAATGGQGTSASRPGALFGPHAPRGRATANAVPN